MPKARKAKPKQEAAAVWVARSSLVPWEGNPRLNDEAVQTVVGSIKRFGFAAPIVARTADNMVIAGHTRLRAAEELELEMVPVRFMDLDPTDARLLALADNRMSELAEWDDIALRRALNELADEGAVLEGLGWDKVPEFEDDPDYSALDGEGDDFLDDLEAGTRKAIQVEFTPEDYGEAWDLVAWWRQQGGYVGGLLLECLREKKDKDAA